MVVEGFLVSGGCVIEGSVVVGGCVGGLVVLNGCVEGSSVVVLGEFVGVRSSSSIMKRVMNASPKVTALSGWSTSTRNTNASSFSARKSLLMSILIHFIRGPEGQKVMLAMVSSV